MLYKRLLNSTPVQYQSPEEFLAAAISYFEWAESNPIQEETINFYKGAVIRADVNKMRPFTKHGLATYLGIPLSRLDTFKKREGWAEVVELIEQAIYDQKFTGAAAGMLNPGLITRDLGIAEKKEITGADGAPMQVVQYQLPSNGRDHMMPDAVMIEEVQEDADERPA